MLAYLSATYSCKEEMASFMYVGISFLSTSPLTKVARLHIFLQATRYTLLVVLFMIYSLYSVTYDIIIHAGLPCHNISIYVNEGIHSEFWKLYLVYAAGICCIIIHCRCSFTVLDIVMCITWCRHLVCKVG